MTSIKKMAGPSAHLRTLYTEFRAFTFVPGKFPKPCGPESRP